MPDLRTVPGIHPPLDNPAENTYMIPTMRYSKPYHDAVGLQRLITASAPTADPKSLALIGRTFVALELLKLRLKMKGAPKPVDVSKLERNANRTRPNAPSFSET